MRPPRRERRRRVAISLCFALVACSSDPDSPRDAGAPVADGGGAGGAGGAAGANPGSSARGGGGGGGQGAGRGGSGGSAGAAGSDDLDDGGAGYAPLDTGRPGPKGSVRGSIIGLADTDVLRAVVTAGGVVGSITPSGHFFVGGVPVGNAVAVFVRASGYSIAHARVPVREREETPLPLELKKFDTQSIVDPALAFETTFGDGPVKHSLRWPESAMQTIYGTAATGPMQLLTASLGARLAPANNTATGAQPLRAFKMVEIAFQQPRAALMLVKKATLALHLDLSAGSSTPSLYRFDERSGYFEKLAGSSFDATALILTAEIDRPGIYAAATTGMELGCTQGRLADASGGGVPFAAIRYQNPTQEEGGLAWTGADGQYCLRITPTQPIVFSALGVKNGALLALDLANVPAAGAVAACGSAGCLDAGSQTLIESPMGCVRGRLSKLGVPISADIRANVDDESRTHEVRVSAQTGSAFCIDTSVERRLSIGGVHLRCGETRTLSPPPKAAASCAENNCVDLGEIGCCTDTDTCGDAIDDDCDGRVDEGCTCGSTSCSDAHVKHLYLNNHCCADTSFCGFRYPTAAPVDHCFAFGGESAPDPGCPSAQSAIAGNTLPPSGCCALAIDQCGLNIEGVCIPRSEIQYLSNMSLAPIPCSVP